MSATHERAPTSRWRAVGLAAVWPTILGWVVTAVDPVTAVESILDRGAHVPATESPVIASQLMYFPDSALCFLPGLILLHHAGVRGTRASERVGRVWALTLGAGLATLLVGTATHLAMDLPTGDLGTPEVIERVRLGTRYIDVALYSIFPALLEEFYFRGRLFDALSPALTPRTTILVTTLAFAACHPLNLVPFALVWGAVAGLVRYRLGSFWPMVAAHAVWNAIAYADAWMLLG